MLGLIREYKNGLKELKNLRDKTKFEIELMTCILCEDLLENESIKEKFRHMLPVWEKDLGDYSYFISNYNFGIRFMDTARNPNEVRGIERRGVYKLQILMDSNAIDELEVGNEERDDIPEDKLKALYKVLELLSEREREIYVMIKGMGYSYGYVADLLGISRSRVQDAMKRAEKKIIKFKDK